MIRKKCLFSLILALLASIPSLVSADIVTGKAVDDKTGEPLAMASVKMECKMGGATYWSSTTTDSLGYFSNQCSLEGRLTVTVSLLGYHDAKKKGYCGSGSTADTIKLGECRLKPSDVVLDEVMVSAKAKRFTIQGDTIVFNPAAFKLTEGARLKELIEKLPGVTKKDGKLYWNDKPLRLQMNGHDIFGGSGIVADLPAEAVQNIKSYNKASEFAKHSGKDDGKEDQVLDIKIKAGFMDKWYGDIKARVQSSKNYQASIKSSKLSDRNPIMFHLDANNINQYQKVGTNWWQSGDFDYFGKAQNAALGYQHNWNKGKNNENYIAFASNFNHKDGWGTDYEAAQYFSPKNVTTWSLNRKKHYNHEIAPEVRADLFSYTDENNFIAADLTFNYTLERNNTETSSARFDTDTKPYGDFPLDLALSAGHGDAIYRHIINRERSYQQHINEGGSIDFSGTWKHFIGKKAQLEINTTLSYENGNNRFDAHRELEYISKGTASPLYQYSRAPFHKIEANGKAALEYHINDALLLNASQQFKAGNNKIQQSFYSSPIASKIEDDPESVLDAANSYRSKKHETATTSSVGLTCKVGKWQFIPKLDFSLNSEELNYQRGRLDTVAHRNSNTWTPEMLVKWKINKSHRFDFAFNYTTKLPDLLSTLGYRDDTDPFWIVEGNPFLRRSHQHTTSLNYVATLGKQQAMLLFKAGYTHIINPIATVYNFNPQTGVYRSHNKNVRSGNDWFIDLTFDKSFGDYIHFSNKLEMHFKKSYGYLATLNEHTAQEENEMKMFTFISNPELSYESDWLQAGIFGEIDLQRNRYSLASQYNNTPIRYAYGLRATVKWKGWEISSEIKDRAATGYLAQELNRHRILWESYIRYVWKKSKNWIGLSFDDILNQNREYSLNVNSSNRIEKWNEIQHHYVCLTFNYHFDAKGKKK